MRRLRASSIASCSVCTGQTLIVSLYLNSAHHAFSFLNMVDLRLCSGCVFHSAICQIFDRWNNCRSFDFIIDATIFSWAETSNLKLLPCTRKFFLGTFECPYFHCRHFWKTGKCVISRCFPPAWYLRALGFNALLYLYCSKSYCIIAINCGDESDTRVDIPSI